MRGIIGPNLRKTRYQIFKCNIPRIAKSQVHMDASNAKINNIQPSTAREEIAKKNESETKEKKDDKKTKTMAELDEELRLKLEEMSGEGGAAGLEYENGKAVALKRGVKANMFRYI